LSSLFDEYSLNARVRPALLAILSPTVFVYLLFPQLYNLLAGAISIFIVFGMVTALGHFSRSFGKTAEGRLFSSWGGKPTTSLLRHSDNHIDSITKRRYHKFLTERIDGWVPPTEEEELNDPRASDQSYDSAVKWLIEYTRNQKQYSILFKENISYGFRRNCYGIKWFAIVLTLLPIMVLIADLCIQSVSIADIGDLKTLVYICLSLVLTAWWALIVKADWVKEAANAYSVRLLASCENNEHT